MEKRFITALLLSFLVLLTWNTCAPRPPKPADQAATTEVDAGSAAPKFDTERALVSERLAEASERELSVRLGTPGEPGSYLATFTNRGARLLSLRLGDYFVARDLDDAERADTERWVEVLSSVESDGGRTGSLAWSGGPSSRALLTEPLEDALWQARELEGGGVEFTYAPGTGVVFTKRVTPVPGEHELDVELGIENVAAPEAVGLVQFRFTPADVVRPNGDERFYQEPQALAVWRTDEGELDFVSERKDLKGRKPVGPLVKPDRSVLSYAGAHNKFFAALLEPSDDFAAAAVLGAEYRRVRDAAWPTEHPDDAEEAFRYVVCDLALRQAVPAVGERSALRYRLYAGPKQAGQLEEANPAFLKLRDHDIGMFSGVAKIITAILGFYHGLVGNWGWAIILMTLTVRGLLFPLNRRSQTAMARYAKKMKRVQPLLDANKQKYEKDPKKQREEQARIMQEEGAFPPVGGCLPMFLQMPIFIGLFQALRVDFDLRHQPFVLWMRDLSLPDQLLRLDLNTGLPFLGTIEYLNLLPLLMIGLWITQQKVMPQPQSTSPDQERTKKMMMGMQIFFAFLFYSYASGLALYMICSSSFAIFESLVIKRVWPIDDSEQAKKPPSKFRQRFEAMQKAQLQLQKEKQRQEEQRKQQEREQRERQRKKRK
ncbi:MAG: membrane protein insertase YidC [Planctomycetes bacterium]|nr:membrane protein insertase YidC [Planctomycetota bacterium]